MLKGIIQGKLARWRDACLEDKDLVEAVQNELAVWTLSGYKRTDFKKLWTGGSSFHKGAVIARTILERWQQKEPEVEKLRQWWEEEEEKDKEKRKDEMIMTFQ